MTVDAILARLRALAEPNRLALAEALAGGPASATELLDHVPGLSQPSLSRHLKTLREAGLVEEGRRGRFRRLRLVEDPILREVLRQVREAGGAAAGGKVAEDMSQETSMETPDAPAASEPVPSARDDFQEWLL